MKKILSLAERGKLPDSLIRLGIRLRHAQVLRKNRCKDVSHEMEKKWSFIKAMDLSPIALVPELANMQHYEVPPAFFRLMLGPAMKYSCCLFPTSEGRADSNLEKAEESMIQLVNHRAGLKDGMEVLDLGCGWGSFSLWLARQHPNSSVTAISNAQNQIDHITQQALNFGLSNLKAFRENMNSFQPKKKFDRIVSVEMFEHMRNWRLLLNRIASWLKPDGALFVHIFAHHKYAYLFEQGQDDWMGRHFFSGGMMPSDDLMLYFQDNMQVRGHWRVNGLHYQKTLEAWLRRLDDQGLEALDILKNTNPGDCQGETRLILQRWRIFLMACSELFGWNHGNTWFISHYLLTPRACLS